MFQSGSPLLPFWLLGAPLVLALIDLMRTPRGHVDRHHSSLSGTAPVR